jgi:hypothetical protein
LANSESGRHRIHDIVVAATEKLGIDPKLLVFKWDLLNGMILPEHGLTLKQRVYVLKIYLGKRSQAITFSEKAVQESAKESVFLSDFKKPIVTALRKLVAAEKPVQFRR